MVKAISQKYSYTHTNNCVSPVMEENQEREQTSCAPERKRKKQKDSQTAGRTRLILFLRVEVIWYNALQQNAWLYRRNYQYTLFSSGRFISRNLLKLQSLQKVFALNLILYWTKTALHKNTAVQSKLFVYQATCSRLNNGIVSHVFIIYCVNRSV